MRHAAFVEEPNSGDVSVARRLLDREDLLQMLDRAVSKRVTVVSAPPGSGKTSLLRAWAARSANLRRVASVSVECAAGIFGLGFVLALLILPSQCEARTATTREPS